MSVCRCLVALGWLTLAAPLFGAVTLQRALTLAALPASCSDPGSAVTSFAVTDAQVALIFLVNGQQAGDIASVDYITPAGQVYAPASGPWDPVTASQAAATTLCFRDTALKIAGASAASLTGTWQARVTYNGAPFFTLTFTIGVTTGGGTSNLIRNPGAESSVGDADCVNAGGTIPEWTSNGSVTVCRYGPDAIPAGNPGPPDRGLNFFSGGLNATSSIGQTVNVSSYANSIDTGKYPFSLSGWLGGWSYQDDNATVTATFRNANGAALSSVKIGPVLAAERGSVSELIQKSTSGTVPSGTRSVDVVVTFVRAAGDWNDGAADNLSFILGASGTTPTCNYSLTPASTQVGATAGTGTLTVSATSGCTWNATSSATWLSVTSGSSGSGNGTVAYSYTANNSTSNRSATITAGTQTFTLIQAGAAAPCSYVLTPSSAQVTAAAGTGSLSVSAGSGCAWSVTSSATWLSVTSGSSGSGNGTVAYSYTANPSTSSRSATLTIGTQTFPLAQAGVTTISGTNLLRNPGAEEGLASTDCTGLASISGWTTDGKVTVCNYSRGDYLSPTTPGPTDRGANFFGGGVVDQSSISQVVDLTAQAATIDAGSQGYSFSAWLGGWSDQNDNASVRATFRDSVGAILANVLLGPVLASDRNYASGLLLRSATGTIPARTRSVLVTVSFVRTDGTSNDGYADNISFSLGDAPSTSTGVYYRFENGTGGSTASGTGSITDSSGAGQNGTPSGGPTYNSDVPSPTIPLNGTANRLSMSFRPGASVTFPGAFPLNTLANATLEFWIQPAASSDTLGFLWTRTDSADANRFSMYVLPGRLLRLDYREQNGTVHYVTNTLSLAASGWTHVAVVKAGNVWTSYINGVQQGSPVTDANANLPNNTGWTLNGRNTVPFTGLIDEFRITPSALSPSQFLNAGSSSSCNYSISAQSGNVGAGGGNGSVNVTTGSGCTWTAVSNATWINVTSGGGTGSGTVQFSASANSSTSSRVGTLTIAGYTYTLTQAGSPASCEYKISSASATFPATGGKGTVNVTSGTGCGWTSSTPVTWITITAGSSGSGNSFMEYSVAANTGSSARSATLTIAGQSHKVDQIGAGSTLPAITSVVNYVDSSASIAPGSLIAVNGVNLATATGVPQTAAPALTLYGLTVEITDGSRVVNAALPWVSPGKAYAMLPPDLVGPKVQLRARTAAGDSPSVTLSLDPYAPRVRWTGDGSTLASAIHLDIHAVNDANPAQAGEVIEVHVTGLGPVWPPLDPGEAAGSGTNNSPLNLAMAKITAMIGDLPAAVQSVWLSPGVLYDYAVRLRVPDTLATGNYSVKVMCEGVASQDKVTIPVASPWTSAATAVIDRNGGTITGGNLTLTVPAGSFASPAYLEILTGDGFVLKGVPMDLRGPMTLTVAATGVADGPAMLEISEATGDGSALHLAGTVSGGLFTAGIPGPNGTNAATSAKKPVRALDPTIAHTWVVKGPDLRLQGSTTSSGGNIEMSYWYTADDRSTMQSRMSQLAEDLDGAVVKLGSILGAIEWPSHKWPMAGYYGPFLNPRFWESPGLDGDLTLGKYLQGFDLNSAFFKEMARFRQGAAPTGAHEIFHVLQNLLDVRPAVSIWGSIALGEGGPWLWFEEAISTWFERVVSTDPAYIPSTVRPDTTSGTESSDNYQFILRGLGQRNTRNDGYGASMFLEYLAQEKGTADLGMILSHIGDSTDSLTNSVKPIEAMEILYTPAGLRSIWHDFARKFAGGKLYGSKAPEFPGSLELLGLMGSKRTYDVKSNGARGKVWADTAPAMSAHFYSIALAGTPLEANAKFKIKFQPGGGDFQMTVFRVSYPDKDHTVREIVSQGQTEFVIDNPRDLAANKQTLLIVISHGDQFPAGYQLSVENSTLQNWAEISFFPPPFSCVSTQGNLEPIHSVCNGLPNIPVSSKNSPMRWSGNSFTATSTWTGSIPEDSIVVTMSGALDPATGDIINLSYKAVIHAVDHPAWGNQHVTDGSLTMSVARFVAEVPGGSVFRVPDAELAAAVKSISYELSTTHQGFGDTTLVTKSDPSGPIVAKFLQASLYMAEADPSATTTARK